MRDSLKSGLMVVLFFICVVFLTSCGNDDDPGIVSIEGTWDYNEFDLEIRINNMSDVDFFIQEFGISAAEANIASQALKDNFFDNEDFEETRFVFDSNGSYEIRVDDELDESGTYEVSADNSTLSLISDLETVVFDIEELSRNRLTIALSERFEIDLTDDGVDEDIDLKLIISFVR